MKDVVHLKYATFTGVPGVWVSVESVREMLSKVAGQLDQHGEDEAGAFVRTVSLRIVAQADRVEAEHG